MSLNNKECYKCHNEYDLSYFKSFGSNRELIVKCCKICRLKDRLYRDGLHHLGLSYYKHWLMTYHNLPFSEFFECEQDDIEDMVTSKEYIYYHPYDNTKYIKKSYEKRGKDKAKKYIRKYIKNTVYKCYDQYKFHNVPSQIMTQFIEAFYDDEQRLKAYIGRLEKLHSLPFDVFYETIKTIIKNDDKKKCLIFINPYCAKSTMNIYYHSDKIDNAFNNIKAYIRDHIYQKYTNYNINVAPRDFVPNIEYC